MLLAVALGLALLNACRANGPTRPESHRDAVVVASFNFTESELLAEIYAQALQAAGVPVRRELDLGTREMVLPALRQGLVDVVPEYLGTALSTVAPRSLVDHSDTVEVLTALRQALRAWHLTVLAPAPAADANALVVTRALAQRRHVRTLTDLAALRLPLRLAAPPECASREYCLPGLRDVYKFAFQQVVAIDDGAQRIIALTEGLADAAITFTTDGRLAAGGLVVLADDRHLQPTERIAPVLSDRALQRYGAAITTTLDAVSAALTTDALRFLNWRVDVAGKPLAAEAGAWLRRHGLLERR